MTEAVAPKVKLLQSKTKPNTTKQKRFKPSKLVPQFDDSQDVHTLNLVNKPASEQKVRPEPEVIPAPVQRIPTRPLNIKFKESPKGQIPEIFKDTLIAGAKKPIERSEDAPSCFCETNEICQQHALYLPSIDDMITLVEGQIDEINKDERSFDVNLDFIHQTLESILITRRDTFKEQLTRYYKEKDDEVRAMNEKVRVMEKQERMLEAVRNELRDTASQNASYKQQLEKI